MVKNAPKGRLCNVFSHFISDTHLFHPHNGGAFKHMRMMLDSDAKQIFLIGDTFDMWEVNHRLLRKRTPLDQFPRNFIDALVLADLPLSHINFANVMMQKQAGGVPISVFTGNHDIGLKALEGQSIEGISIKKDEIYTGADTRRFLIEHGHLFDHKFLQDYSGLYGIGSTILDGAMALDYNYMNKIPYLSDSYAVSNALKGTYKSAVNKDNLKRAFKRAGSRGVDGIICGHSHLADVTLSVDSKSISHINCGDGLTRGISIVQKTNGNWKKAKAKHIISNQEETWAKVKQAEAYQPRSVAFLQKVWEAHLEVWNQEAAQKRANTSDGVADKIYTVAQPSILTTAYVPPIYT